MTIRLASTSRVSRLAVVLCWGAFLSSSSLAAVQVTGDVTPSDNPFTDIVINPTTGVVSNNEGIQEYIPFFGDIFDPPGSVPPQDTFEEGDDDKVDIEVGKTSYGSLLLNGGSILRYGHLVIGGNKDDANSEPGGDISGDELGVGVVRIEGFGTVYNSEPEILPGGLPPITDPTPRAIDGGFDVYVGLTGSGTLEVADGGRMEIQDGLIVGLAEGAYGELLVDGFSAHIDQRGNGEGDDSLSQMLIGPVGTGIVTIQNGAQVDARNGAALGTVASDGGGILIGGIEGGIPFFAGAERGGRGVATVDGLGSTWRVTDGIAIGTFFPDITDYTPSDGEGEMTISNDGLVSIIANTDDDPSNMVVGKFGRVNLVDGRIIVADDVTSDGVLRGDGRVDAAHFSNRRLGEVRVGQDQKLLVTSSATEVATDDVGDFYMANDGLVEVLNGEIEFQRLFETDDDMFKNRFVPATMDLPEQKAVILSQNSVMRFHSGLSNEAVVGFTNGNNVVGGDVINQVDAEIIISGYSNVTFEDDLTNLGVLDLAPDGSLVTMTVLGDFIGVASAALNMNLGGGPTGAELSHIAVAGDITIGGELHVDLSTTGTNPIVPMPGDEFEIISGASLLMGSFSVLDLPMLSNPGWNWFIDTANSDVTLTVLDIIAIGADFNGDGIVDALDLAIWEMNFGLTMGGTGVLGDADLDGDVDGDDFFVWLEQVGGPGMIAGALNLANNQVPEPSTLLMAACGVTALCLARRRQSQR
ncbi:MAG: PEP-CTERM sorting domain-containing protein [Aeoliella sp.]